jgi:general stress protein YciG
MSEITAADAARALGRLGGRATAKTYGADHYRAMAKRTPVKPRAFYEQIGRRGAAAMRARFDEEEYEALSRTGGEALLAQRGIDHYRELGRKSAAARAAKRAAS